MKTRLFLWLTAFCLCSLSLHSQTYSGWVVRDGAKQEPLETASVMLLAADSAIVSYAYTDKDGYFELRSVPKGRFIAFSHIGFARRMLPLSAFSDGMTVALEETGFKLREVKVASGRIRVTKDTLTYAVSGFKSAQDRSIADVLKKLPGIEVTSSGIIKFQDKPISHFYVEGMDLLGRKYTLGSKNIPAKMVKEVQVLQNHQPITALRGKSFSERAALNLTLTEEAKYRLVMQADLGAGGGEEGMLWNTRLLGMLFGRKMQNLSLYKNNNTGEEIAQEIRTMNTALGSAEGNEESDLFGRSASNIGNIPRERYLFNRSHLAAINHLYKPNRKSDYRLQLSALHDEESADSRSGTTYYYPDQTITIDEERAYAGQTNRLEGEAIYQYNDSLLYLKNTVSGNIGMHKSWLRMNVNGQPTAEQASPERKFLQNRFELIRNLGQKTFSVYSNNAYSDLPQVLTVAPGINEELLNGGEAYDCLRQEARLRAFTSDTYTYLQHKLAGFYMRYRVGFRYVDKRMTSSLYADDAVRGDDFRNDVRFRNARFYAEPGISFKSAFWNFQFRVPVYFSHYYLRNKSDVQRKERLLPSPRLNVKYELNSFWNVAFSSNYSWSEPDIRRLYAGYMFTSYRSASAFEPRLSFDRSWLNSLDLSFSQPLCGFFSTLTGYYTISHRELIYGYAHEGSYLTLCNTYTMPHDNRSWGIRGRASKAWGWWKSYAALNVSYSDNRSKLLLSERLTDSSLESLLLKLELSMQPCRYLSLNAGSTATHSRSTLDYEGGQENRTWRYQHQLTLNFLFSSRWRASLANQVSHDDMEGGVVTHFADASLTYSRRRFEIELSGRNLFNRSQLDYVVLNSLTERYSTYRLRPREFMVKLLLSF